MKPIRITFVLLVLTALVSADAAEKPSKKITVDFRKSVIESPVKNILANNRSEKPPAQSAETQPVRTLVSSQTLGKSFNNPKVKAGNVQWHPDFEKACAAAVKSGKPMLLFQLFGRLDEQFT